MNASIATSRQLLRSRKEPMDILWGAWVEYVRLDQSQRSVDIMGIYDTIQKEKRSDFPFAVNLIAILAMAAEMAECSRTFVITMEMLDLDATTRLFSVEEEITIPEGDSPLR